MAKFYKLVRAFFKKSIQMKHDIVFVAEFLPLMIDRVHDGQITSKDDVNDFITGHVTVPKPQVSR